MQSPLPHKFKTNNTYATVGCIKKYKVVVYTTAVHATQENTRG